MKETQREEKTIALQELMEYFEQYSPLANVKDIVVQSNPGFSPNALMEFKKIMDQCKKKIVVIQLRSWILQKIEETA